MVRHGVRNEPQFATQWLARTLRPKKVGICYLAALKVCLDPRAWVLGVGRDAVVLNYEVRTIAYKVVARELRQPLPCPIPQLARLFERGVVRNWIPGHWEAHSATLRVFLVSTWAMC